MKLLWLSTKGEKLQQIAFSLIIYFASFLVLGPFFSNECWAGDFKVAIDIGHTKNIPGAISSRGVPEYQFNKRIGILLHETLVKDKKFKRSFIINENGDDMSLSARAETANRQGADLFVSIHHDSVDPIDLSYRLYKGKAMSYCDKYAGYSIFYSERNGDPLKSLIFAVVLGSEMIRAGFCPTLHHVKKFTGGDKALIDRTRGIYKYNNLVVLKNTDMPALLFECGIIKNEYEELQLSNSEYQKRIVNALISAIKKCFAK